MRGCGDTARPRAPRAPRARCRRRARAHAPDRPRSRRPLRARAARSAEVRLPEFEPPSSLSPGRWPLALHAELDVSLGKARPREDAPYVVLGFYTAASEAQLKVYDAGVALWASGVGLLGALVLANFVRFLRSKPGGRRTRSNVLVTALAVAVACFFAGCVAAASAFDVTVRSARVMRLRPAPPSSLRARVRACPDTRVSRADGAVAMCPAARAHRCA